jgi:hypothetical protein
VRAKLYSEEGFVFGREEKEKKYFPTILNLHPPDADEAALAWMDHLRARG